MRAGALRGRGGLLLAVLCIAVAAGVLAVWLTTRDDGGQVDGTFTAVVGARTATLSGSIPSEAVKAEIGARAAELVGGAANVTNDLVVDSGVASGPWLEATIGAFAGLPPAPRPISYTVAGGTLTLEADTATAADKAALMQTVRSLVEGRLAIDDRVTVGGG